VPFVPASSIEPDTINVAVSNFPATQAVSVATLPLPAGAATEATLDRVKRAANDLAFPDDAPPV
jgi:hypothetical protein